MYWWHICNRNANELIHRVYLSQRLSPSHGDWVKLLDYDRNELGITLADEDMQTVGKETFKKFVKKKVKQKLVRQILEGKSKKSKSAKLDCVDIKTAEYLSDTRFTTKQKQILFKLRSRTLDVKENFKFQYTNLWCETCGLFVETQAHLLQCPELVKDLHYVDVTLSQVDEKLIYGNADQQLKIVKIYCDILDKRNEILSSTRRAQCTLPNK